ncbi:hypothetical protein P280DRAFT_397288 [Massarina eburnea CBS 473.64]|uniref:Rhodopsin domain-containing protein n=1 Tax=Massarina eburnea CBS 473.64 TaxID=1395130 RepID=A0A6A6S6F5_9PLEO|nr:hypothetical protein P280DRAFT_397288 [Massarina eburnea CBS 473.64]
MQTSIGLLVLGARLYTRARIVRNVGWDDWIMVLATILAVMTSIVVTKEVQYGVGKHAAYLPPPDLIKAVKWIWLSTPMSTLSACFGKISIALLLMRIINRNKYYRFFLWVLIGLLLAINIVLNIITFIQCRPTWWLWEQLNPMTKAHGTCWNPDIQKFYGYFQGSFSAFSDLVLALFPILIIKDLQIELKLKAALCSVMGMGILATVAAIVKTVELKNLATPDFTYNAIDLIYWFISENWLIVIAACIPTLGPLYFVLLGKRTAESYAAPSRPGSGGAWGGNNWKWPGIRSWKMQSVRSKTSNASSSGGSLSRMEKGHGSLGGSVNYSSHRSVDERSEAELVPIKNVGERGSTILKTTHVSVS